MPKKEICATALEAVATSTTAPRSSCTASARRRRGRPIACWRSPSAACKDLTIICNTPAGGPTSLNILADKKQIRKLVCSYVGSPAIPDADQRAGEGRRDRARDGAARDADRARARRRRRAGRASTRRPASARRSPRARRSACSTASAISSSAPSAPTSLCSRPIRPTPRATSPIAAACATSAPAFAMAAKTTIAEVKEIVPLGGPSIPKPWSPRASSSTAS